MTRTSELRRALMTRTSELWPALMTRTSELLPVIMAHTSKLQPVIMARTSELRPVIMARTSKLRPVIMAHTSELRLAYRSDIHYTLSLLSYFTSWLMASIPSVIPKYLYLTEFYIHRSFMCYGALYPPTIHVLWNSMSANHSHHRDLYICQSFTSSGILLAVTWKPDKHCATLRAMRFTEIRTKIHFSALHGLLCSSVICVWTG